MHAYLMQGILWESRKKGSYSMFGPCWVQRRKNQRTRREKDERIWQCRKSEQVNAWEKCGRQISLPLGKLLEALFLAFYYFWKIFQPFVNEKFKHPEMLRKWHSNLLMPYIESRNDWQPWLLYSSFLCCHLVAQSCPTLCHPMDGSLPGSSVHGILQARILEWVAISSSRDLPDPEIEPKSLISPALALCFTFLFLLFLIKYIHLKWHVYVTYVHGGVYVHGGGKVVYLWAMVKQHRGVLAIPRMLLNATNIAWPHSGFNPGVYFRSF